MRRHLERARAGLTMAALSVLSACGLEIPPDPPAAPRAVTPPPVAPLASAPVPPAAY